MLRLRSERQADNVPLMNEDQRSGDVVDQRVGYAYRSSNDQLVIDRCASDQEHLIAPATSAETPMHDCRRYLESIVPKEWIDRHGKFTIRRMTSPGGKVLEVSIAFEPC